MMNFKNVIQTNDHPSTEEIVKQIGSTVIRPYLPVLSDDDLIEKYLEDPRLRNIPVTIWDRAAGFYCSFGARPAPELHLQPIGAFTALLEEEYGIHCSYIEARDILMTGAKILAKELLKAKDPYWNLYEKEWKGVEKEVANEQKRN